MRNRISLVSSVRTPTGLVNGSLKDLKEQDLAGKAMKSLLEGIPFPSDRIEEVILGVSKQTSKPSNCARHAALLAGFSENMSAYTVQRQSVSGLQAVYNACLLIQANYAKFVLAGGCESASNLPVEIHNARYSFDSRTRFIYDIEKAHEIGAQPSERYGRLDNTAIAERLTIRYNLTQQDLSDYAEKSLIKTMRSALLPGLTLEVRRGKQMISLNEDQLVNEPRQMPVLADGAAAMLLAERDSIESDNILATIIDITVTAGVPDRPEETICRALLELLKRNNLLINQLNLIELAEPSAACSLAIIKLLTQTVNERGYLTQILNPNGGMLAYGNTWGAGGTILLDRLVHGLRQDMGGFGVAISYAEGGQAMAILVQA